MTETRLNGSNNRIDANGHELSRNLPNSEDEGDLDFSETDIEAEEYILTELEHWVQENNTRVAVRMVKKAGGKARRFAKGWIVTLAIPSKLRLRTKSKRLLCYVDQVTKN